MSPELFALIFVLVVFAGVFIVFMGLRQRSQQMELQHRERMAMIERGQIPTAEPAGWHRPGHRAARGGSASPTGSGSSHSSSLGRGRSICAFRRSSRPAISR